MTLEEFERTLHPSTVVLSHGRAEVGGRTVSAIKVRNLYKQEVVWGMFGQTRGKFKGHLANNCNTDGVIYNEDSVSE